MALGWVEELDLTGPQGPQGIQGEPGEQGPAGEPGAQGETGPQGVQGTQGPAGTAFDPEDSVATVDDLPAGDAVGKARMVRGPGQPSEAGPAGHIFVKEESGWTDFGQSAYVGPEGPIGETGPQGPAGPKGDTGNTGPQGNQGVHGNQGPQGLTGSAGPKGDTGLQGPKGDQGETGAAGPQGTAGTSGSDGARGSLNFSYLDTGSDTPPSSGNIQPNDRFYRSDGKVLVLRNV